MNTVALTKIDVVPSLKAHLRSSTAMTPTSHKGKLAMVIGIVASIAIPFAAPAIATAIGTSMGVSMAAGSFALTAGSAMAGAALGAGVAFATGGNPLMGAIGGGIGGGIAGYNYVPSGPAGSVTGGLGPGGGGGNIAGQMGQTPIPTTSMPTGAGGMPYGEASASLDPFVLPGTGTPTPTFDLNRNFNLANALDNTSSEGLSMGLTGGGPDMPTGAGGMPYGEPSVSGTSSRFSMPDLDAMQPPTFASRFNAGLNTAGDKLSEFASSLPDRAVDAITGKVGQQAAGKLLTMGIGKLAVGDSPDMTAPEQALQAQLAQARGQQEDQLAKRIAASDSYIQQAANINPAYYGQQALTDEQNRLARAQQAGLRRVNPSSTGQQASMVRANALDRSRLGGFSQGSTAGEASRLKYMQAAQTAAPTGSGYAGDIASDLKAEDARYNRLVNAGQEYSDLVTPLTNSLFGVMSEKEREEERKKKGIN